MDPGSFERFKEQMKANAAQIKAIQAGEQKQKQKEDKLAKILLKFIKTTKKNDLVLLISRCLEENVPAALILSIVLLGNEDIQEDTGIRLALPPGFEHLQVTSSTGSITHREVSNVSALHSDLPLNLRLTIDLWAKNILETCKGTPHKILKNILDKEGSLKPIVLQLTTHVLIEYLQGNAMTPELDPMREFTAFLFKGIIHELKQQIERQKELSEHARS